MTIKTAKEYWDVIQANQGRVPSLQYSSVWPVIEKQVSAIITKDPTASTQEVINSICAMDYPEDLGTCDSQEYDTILVQIVKGLEKVGKDNGETIVIPANAPTECTLVRSGMISYWTGTSREMTKRDEEARKSIAEMEAEYDKLDTTEGCRDVLVKQFKGTSKSDWKRKKKFTLHGKTVRIFQNKKSGSEVSVVLDPEDMEEGAQIVNEAISNSNPANKFPKVYGPNRSGKVYFALNTIEDGEVSFYCGPEMSDGSLDDLDDEGVINTLEELFKGYDIELRAAENFHIIHPKTGQSEEALAQFVVETIVNAGALHDKEASLQDCPDLNL